MAPSNFGRKMFSYKGLTLMTAPLAVLVAAGAVMGASANLSAQTSNDGNSWSTPAKLALGVSTDTTSAMFTATDISPGYSESHCITITNDSPVATTLKTYSANFEPTTLGNAMTINVVEGSGGVDDAGIGSADHCDSFVPDAAPAVFDGTMSSFAASTDYATGLGSKLLSADQSVQYKITVSLPGTIDPATVEEMRTGINFKWEIQD